MIKNVLFDLGGVVITLCQPEAIRRFAALGLTDAADYLDQYTQGGIFGKLEEGSMSAEDFRNELSRIVGREITASECRHAWLGYRAELPARNLDTLRRLRAEGYRLLLLSNTNPYMMDWALSSEFDGNGHSINDYFDALYLSYQMRAMKPDVSFFRMVLEKENILPEECLFVDDGARNTAVASSLGIKTFCPENGSDWTQEIDKYLK